MHLGKSHKFTTFAKIKGSNKGQQNKTITKRKPCTLSCPHHQINGDYKSKLNWVMLTIFSINRFNMTNQRDDRVNFSLSLPVIFNSWISGSSPPLMIGAFFQTRDREKFENLSPAEGFNWTRVWFIKCWAISIKMCENTL